MKTTASNPFAVASSPERSRLLRRSAAAAAIAVAMLGAGRGAFAQEMTPVDMASELLMESQYQNASLIGSVFGAAPDSPLSFTSYVDPSGMFISFALVAGEEYNGLPMTLEGSGTYDPDAGVWTVESVGTLGDSVWTTGGTHSITVLPDGSVMDDSWVWIDPTDEPPRGTKTETTYGVDLNGKKVSWTDTWETDKNGVKIPGTFRTSMDEVKKSGVWKINPTDTPGPDPRAIFSDGFSPLPSGGEGWFETTVALRCVADCDGSGELDIDDFIYYQLRFATGDAAADCDGSGNLDIDDFICFQSAFAVGCP